MEQLAVFFLGRSCRVSTLSISLLCEQKAKWRRTRRWRLGRAPPSSTRTPRKGKRAAFRFILVTTGERMSERFRGVGLAWPSSSAMSSLTELSRNCCCHVVEFWTCMAFASFGTLLISTANYHKPMFFFSDSRLFCYAVSAACVFQGQRNIIFYSSVYPCNLGNVQCTR